MKWLVLLIAIIVFTGCEHSHPVAEHEHIHEHEHYHENEHLHLTGAVSPYEALAGTYQLENTELQIFSWDEVLNKSEVTTVKTPPEITGELTLTADFKIKMMLDAGDFKLEVARIWLDDAPAGYERPSKTHHHELRGDEWYYYTIPPDSRIIHLYEFPMLGGHIRTFYFGWDGTILSLITYKGYNVSLPDEIFTMRWRKLARKVNDDSRK